MKLNYVVRQSKVRKNGLAPVELSIIINNDRKVISLDRQINPKHWNPKSQTVKNNPEINTYLQAITQKAYNTQTEMLQLGMTFNINTFIEAFKNGVTPSISLLNIYKQHNKQYEQQYTKNLISKTTYLKYQKALEYLQLYIQSIYHTQDIDVTKITPSFVDNHYTFLLNYMNHNSAIKIMKRLKKVIQLAIDEGYISTNPFKMKLTETKIEHNPLSQQQINIIKNKQIDIKRIDNIRNIFLFQCFTGLAYCDMVNLTKDNIKDNLIIINRQKTDIQSVIPLLPQAKEILEKYDYKLPILSNQKFNLYLKELQSICNIPQNLHCHLARHTYATLLINAGVNISTIARAMGHSNTRITEKTYAKLNNETVREEITSKMAGIA